MIVAGGIDLGGTKIEAQIFDENWTLLDSKRVATPADYGALLDACADLVCWIRQDSETTPVGIAPAGLISPISGNAIAANLPTNGKPFSSDLDARAGKALTWLNDCRAFALAEARFGAGTRGQTVMGLLLGTGIGGALVVDGALVNRGQGLSGEYGHTPMSADLVDRHKLPLIRCGCGRRGCYETFGAGPGMEKLALEVTGKSMSTRDIAENRNNDTDAARVWKIWCDIIASLIGTQISTTDPDTVILGGGLSTIQGIVEDLQGALTAYGWDGFALPEIRLASKGETAAGLGAAFAAHQEASQTAQPLFGAGS